MDQPPAPPPPTVPGLTGLSVLARGGYATVYRATQESVGREVAVKIENRMLENERDRRRFLREARAAGRMSSHPHVVDLFDAGVTPDGHPFLIMELCEGSYADRIKTTPLTPVEAREVGVKIADALADSHALGVLHRDVKPANLLISRFGEPALADFGLAVLAETRDTSITLEVLTPAYAPREMFRAGNPPSPASDVYSLCATLYALLRGKPPRWRDDRNPSLITLMDLFEDPIPDLPGVPPGLMNVLRRGMANEPAARPSAVELRDELSALPLAAGVAIGPAVGVAAPTGPQLIVTPQVPAEPTEPASPWSAPTEPRPQIPAPVPPPLPKQRRADPDPEQTVPVRRRRWPFLGAGAAILVFGLLVTGAAWYGLSHPMADPSHSPSPSRGASGSPSTGPTVVVAQCVVTIMGGTCPAAPTCFDRLTLKGGVARAKRLPCTSTHTWEVYAQGKLAPSLDTVDYVTVKASTAVRNLCNSATLGLVSLSAFGWQMEVLPPSPEAFSGGDRTFRCLAGQGPDKLHKPVFTH